MGLPRFSAIRAVTVLSFCAVTAIAWAPPSNAENDLWVLRWASVQGRTYAVDVSIDLQNWSELLPNLAGAELATRKLIWRSGVTPRSLYYRVRKAPKGLFEPRELEETGPLSWESAHTFRPAVFETLFNGEDLSAWKLPAADAEAWVVDEGLLKVRHTPDQRGSVLWTKADYRDFVMTFDFRMGEGVVDSGIFLRNDDQIQIGISGSLQRDLTASPFIPGTGYPVEAEGVAALLKPEDWNTMRIEAQGPRYVTWLNGTRVMSYVSKTAIAEGPIGIQLHSGRMMAIDFRDVQVAELE